VKAAFDSQMDAADRIGVDTSQFNRYCNGRSDVRPEMLTKILSLFDRPTQAAVLKAYLLDQIPRDYSQLVSVSADDPSAVNEDAKQLNLSTVPSEFRNALNAILERCNEKQVYDLVYDFLRDLARLLNTEYARSLDRVNQELAEPSRVLESPEQLVDAEIARRKSGDKAASNRGAARRS
jgi:transcriptional regulator with XRE-family HTH domain